jgi:hypothetical protein
MHRRIIGGVLAAGLLLSTGTASAQVATAIDVWGRYVTAIDLQYRTGDKNTWSYVPKGDFLFLVKGPESDDMALVRYYLDDKPVGEELKCPITSEKLQGSDLSYVSTYRCMPDLEKFGVSKPGKWKAVVGYRQTMEGTDHKDLATYAFVVAGHGGAGGTKEFHVEHDFRIGEAWVHMKQDGSTFDLFTWFKSSDDQATALNRGSAKVRCKVGEEKLEFNQTTNSRREHEHDDYKGKDKVKSRWQFNYFFPDGSGGEFFKAHPGEYKCVLTRGGGVDRIFTFTVADGKPVKPACQTGDKPLVRAPESTTLVKVELKEAKDAAFDAKAFEKGALYGRSGVAKACGF